MVGEGGEGTNGTLAVWTSSAEALGTRSGIGSSIGGCAGTVAGGGGWSSPSDDVDESSSAASTGERRFRFASGGLGLAALAPRFKCVLPPPPSLERSSWSMWQETACTTASRALFFDRRSSEFACFSRSRSSCRIAISRACFLSATARSSTLSSAICWACFEAWSSADNSSSSRTMRRLEHSRRRFEDSSSFLSLRSCRFPLPSSRFSLLRVEAWALVENRPRLRDGARRRRRSDMFAGRWRRGDEITRARAKGFHKTNKSQCKLPHDDFHCTTNPLEQSM